ncbi:hypothetical protein MOQ_000541 [Trypanosoma cruzi marinkellei]|uniref:Optic atrophy 3 protein (OPA3) n=1 Tax=Trypanosoma cruzi marinkellei TaxID=85056 RepID=K2MVH4_TRYCR|nr:hypothetical protein MOQ_000541 [Trypanosoma cruzi marinkellei]
MPPIIFLLRVKFWALFFSSLLLFPHAPFCIRTLPMYDLNFSFFLCAFFAFLFVCVCLCVCVPFFFSALFPSVYCVHVVRLLFFSCFFFLHVGTCVLGPLLFLHVPLRYPVPNAHVFHGVVGGGMQANTESGCTPARVCVCRQSTTAEGGRGGMAPLPAFKFFFLAIRQISKPVVKATVSRAKREKTITRALCLSLGRFSLGISCVIEKWNAEDIPRRGDGLGTNSGSSAAKENQVREGFLVAPRSRSLLQKNTTSGGSDGTQRIGRLFLRLPMQTAWGAFRSAYSSSIDEERLVKIGAEVLIELLVYSILSAALYFELSTASKASEAKEAGLLQRIEALERKVNELVQGHHGDTLAVIEVPEQIVVSRLGRLKKGVDRFLSLAS